MLKIHKITAEGKESSALKMSVELDNGLVVKEEIKVAERNYANIPNTIHYINNIVSPIFTGLKPFYHKELDRMLEDLNKIHNQNKHEINTSFLLSYMLCKAGAIVNKKSVYEYIESIFNPDKKNADKRLSVAYVITRSEQGYDFDETYLIPARFKSPEEELKMIKTVTEKIRTVIKAHDSQAGDFSHGPLKPVMHTNTDLIECIEEAVNSTNYKLNQDIYVGFNANTQNWYEKEGKYVLKDSIIPLNGDELAKFYVKLEKVYPQLIIEAPFATTSWKDWSTLNKAIGDSVLLSVPVDILFDSDELKRAVDQDSASAISIDFKLVPTITSLFHYAEIVRKSDWKIIMQNDSGVDLNNFDIECALGIGADFIKLQYHTNPEFENKIAFISESNQEQQSGTN